MKVVYLSENGVYINENDRVVKKELKYEKGVITSSIGYKHILNLTFKLPKNIEKDMLEAEAEKYIFTEGSLDYTKEYKINYVFKEFDEFYNVEAFVVEVETLKKEFKKYLNVFKYIDFISARPFVFKSYYDIVNGKPLNDIFIYLKEDEAFLSCFENGEFVFVKSVNKLNTLLKQLNKSMEEMEELLINKGLEREKYENGDEYDIVESFFSSFFMKVSNLINYSVNYYSLSKIDRIFFYSPFEINGFIDKYKNFWNLSGIDFEKYEVPTDYDPFDYTALIYNSRHYENEEENFSVFPKPVPFYKRRSGILTMVTLFSFAAIGADALYKYEIIKKQEETIYILNKKISKKKRESELIVKTVKNLKKQISSVKEQNIALQKQIADIGDKIMFLADIQKTPPVSNEISDLVRILKKYGLKLSSFEKNGIHTDLVVTSKFNNSAHIASFMKDMSKLGYKNVSSKQIKNSNGIYVSKVSYDE
ncbi:hypothetical protein [Nautilia sp.]